MTITVPPMRGVTVFWPVCARLPTWAAPTGAGVTGAEASGVPTGAAWAELMVRVSSPVEAVGPT